MKKEDLRIGDLVKYKDSICVVAGIGFNDSISLLPTVTSDPKYIIHDAYSGDVSDITLTEDILKESHWKTVADGAYRKDGIIEVDFVGSGQRCYVLHSDKHNFIGYIETVSQLQHILHDVGLNSILTINPHETDWMPLKTCKVMQIQSCMAEEPWKVMNQPDKTRCFELASHCIAKALINDANDSYRDDIKDMCGALNESERKAPVPMITYINDTTFMPTRYYDGCSYENVYIVNGNKIFAMAKDRWTEFETEKDAIQYIIHHSPGITPDLVVNLSDFE